MKSMQTNLKVFAAALLGCFALPVLAAPANAGASEAEQFVQGKAQYSRTCAQCHGFNMVNSGSYAYDLRKFPLEQEERFKRSVHSGKGNMPAFGTSLNEDQIHYLWVYIKHRGKAPG